MTQELKNSILRVGELNLAGYQRLSKASPEVLETLGLNANDDNIVRIGSASIPEFVILEATNIEQNDFVTWDLNSLQQDMKVEGVYPCSPESDSLKFELLTEEGIQFESILNKNETFTAFPIIIYGATHSLKITAREDIDFIQIVLKPVSVLEVRTPVQSVNSRNPLNERQSLAR